MQTPFKLKSCGKCGGDLELDEGDWLCVQCGTYYYTGDTEAVPPLSGNARLPGENRGHTLGMANRRKEE